MGERHGLLIVLTGNGKGKTTAALGTAFRAAGQGLRTLMIQFIKGSWHTGELDAAQMLGEAFQIRTAGRGFVKIGTEKPAPEDVALAEAGWREACEAIRSEEFDLVILDEINYAVHYGMIPIERVVEDLKARPPQVHVICTGRNAHPLLVEAADMVSEIKAIKHHYQTGIKAQRGIEY
ncbi:MAG: cob(I)yrinic acid a,c-diamide adenosyltransferase [Bryobacteraceae bacterium]